MQTRDVALLAMNEMLCIYVRAYIRKKYPQKVFTRSQRVSKQLKFSGLRCEGLGFSSLHTPHRPFIFILLKRSFSVGYAVFRNKKVIFAV